MVWNTHTKSPIEQLADEWERAMGFHTRTTTPLRPSEGQRRFLLGQTMDLNTMMRTIGLCLALQKHFGIYLLYLRIDDSGQV